MKSRDFDILIVGSGPGGKEAALTGAHMGKKVGIIERKPALGGVGLQTGTIPSKALREAAYLRSRFASRGMRRALGSIHAESDAEFLNEAIATKNAIIDKQQTVLLNQLLRNGITLLPGEASFIDPHTLHIITTSGQVSKLTADIIILAAGSRPRRPSEIPFDKKFILDSTSLLKIRNLPESLIVIGGGVIGCELATIFSLFGVKITIIDSHERLLAHLDEDITSNLYRHMEDMDIEIHMSVDIDMVCYEKGSAWLKTKGGTEYEAASLLYAMGRVPNLELLKIEAAGLKPNKHGYIPVGDYSESEVPHIYVVGDLAGRPALAATAMAQGRRAVSHAFGEPYNRRPTPLPMAIYTIPELSYVGATERELQQEKIDYVSGYGHYTENARGQIIGANRGMVKILASRESRKILGAHIIGENASELVHIAQMAMGYGGIIDDLADNVYNYPTLAECYKTAALDCLNRLA